MAKRVRRSDEKEKKEFKLPVDFKPVNIKRVLQICIVMCLLGGLVYFRSYLSLDQLSGFFSGISIFSGGQITSSQSKDISFVGNERNQYLSYKGNLTVAAVDGIKMYDRKSGAETAVKLSYEKPVASAGSRQLLCYDMNGSSFAIIQDDKLKNEVQTNGKVLMGEINDSNFSVIVTSDQSYKGVATVYDNSQEKLYGYNSPDNIVDATLSPMSDRLLLLTLDTSQNNLSSKLTVYDLSAEDAEGENSYRSDGMFLWDAKYKSGNLVAAVGDDELVLLSSKMQERAKYEFNGRQLMGYSLEPQNHSVVALSENKTGTQCAIRSIDNNGELKGEYVVKESIQDVQANDQMILVLTKSSIIQLNSRCELVKELDLVKDLAVTENVQKLVIGKGNVYLVGQNWAKNLILA